MLKKHNLDEAVQIAKKLALEISDYVFKVPEGVLHITLSMGVSALKQETEYTALIQEADDRLLLAKRSGKNRIIDGIE